MEAASDAAQQTLMKAWERPPEGQPPRRAWLARVLTNVLRENARSAQARRGREERTAREAPEGRGDGALPVLERLDTQRRVVDALDDLEEPYRTTLVLRFLDGLSVRAVSARTKVPVKTTYTRIERGLARLRERLDHRFGGDRSAWVNALYALPPAGWSLGSSGTVLLKGLGAMSTGTKIAAGSLVCAIGITVVASTESDSRRGNALQQEEETVSAREPALDTGEPLEVERRVMVNEVSPLPETSANDTTEASVAMTEIALRGRLLDLEGRPLAGYAVGIEGRGTAQVTDGTGNFELAWWKERLPATIGIRDSQYTTLRSAWVDSSSYELEQLVIATRSGDIGGLVENENGDPIANATVRLAFDPGLLKEFPSAFDTTIPRRESTRTDAKGAFSLTGVPLPPGTRVRASKSGHERGELALQGVSDTELRLRLRELAPGERDPLVTGIVYLPDGRPAANAFVRYDALDTLTDESGRFELPIVYSVTADQPIAAGKAGYGTVLVERFGELQRQASPGAPAPLTITLLPNSPSLSGFVVDSEGRGQPGWTVRFEEGTPVTRRRVPPIFAEAMDGTTPESRTAEDGSFVLRNLLPREYTLYAFHSETLERIEGGTFLAGAEEVLLRVPVNNTHPRVAGIVVSPDGTPLAGVDISVSLVMHQADGAISWTSRAFQRTDELGRFSFEDVPKKNVMLSINGEEIIPERKELEEGMDLENLELEVSRRFHFRAEVSGARLNGLIVSVLDDAGEPLTIHEFTGRGSTSYGKKELHDGKMPVCAVSGEAATLVLTRYNGLFEKEVSRKEINLVPHEVNLIRFDL